MISAFSASSAGLFSAQRRMLGSAQRIATATQGGELPDVAREAVEQTLAKTQFKASAAVLKTADEMTGTLLDILA